MPLVHLTITSESSFINQKSKFLSVSGVDELWQFYRMVDIDDRNYDLKGQTTDEARHTANSFLQPPTHNVSGPLQYEQILPHFYYLPSTLNVHCILDNKTLKKAKSLRIGK